MYRNGIKRLLAVVLSLCGMICLSWLFLILAVAIKLDSPGPVFFKQKRVGIGKKHFYILKFRTMRIDTPHDMPTHLLHDPDQYITRMGHFLRKTSLDELPQLWNIFVGDMAVIGPRPALWNQYDLLAERDKYHANDVRPGLTGWAQIHGRDELEIAEKAKLDGWYVEHLSFGLDVKCFFGTIAAVLKHDGEDKPYYTQALTMLDKMLTAQTGDVDIVSGATLTCEGLRDAVQDALGKAAA